MEAPPVANQLIQPDQHIQPILAAMKMALLRKNNSEYVENERLRKQIRTVVGKYHHLLLLARGWDETCMQKLTLKDQLLIASKYR